MEHLKTVCKTSYKYFCTQGMFKVHNQFNTCTAVHHPSNQLNHWAGTTGHRSTRCKGQHDVSVSQVFIFACVYYFIYNVKPRTRQLAPIGQSGAWWGQELTELMEGISQCFRHLRRLIEILNGYEGEGEVYDEIDVKQIWGGVYGEIDVK